MNISIKLTLNADQQRALFAYLQTGEEKEPNGRVEQARHAVANWGRDFLMSGIDVIVADYDKEQVRAHELAARAEANRAQRAKRIGKKAA